MKSFPWHDGEPVVALFRNGFQAQLAVDNLLNIGLPESGVALIRRDDAEAAEAMRKAARHEASVDSGVAGPLVGGRAGVAGALVSAGVPEVEAQDYAARVQEGDVLLVVRCQGLCEKVHPILENYGAVELSR